MRRPSAPPPDHASRTLRRHRRRRRAAGPRGAVLPARTRSAASRSSARPPTASKRCGSPASCGPTWCSSTCRCPASPASRSRAGWSSADVPPQLVFVTAFDQYAVDAFTVNAVDYLLKPVDADRLEQTLERARRRLASEAGGADCRSPPADLEKVIEAVQARQGRRDQLAIRVGRTVRARAGRRGRSRLAGR